MIKIGKREATARLRTAIIKLDSTKELDLEFEINGIWFKAGAKEDVMNGLFDETWTILIRECKLVELEASKAMSTRMGTGNHQSIFETRSYITAQSAQEAEDIMVREGLRIMWRAGAISPWKSLLGE